MVDMKVMGISGNTKELYPVMDANVTYDNKLMGLNLIGIDLGEISGMDGTVGIIGADYLDKYKLIINFNNNTIYQ